MTWISEKTDFNLINVLVPTCTTSESYIIQAFLIVEVTPLLHLRAIGNYHSIKLEIVVCSSFPE